MQRAKTLLAICLVIAIASVGGCENITSTSQENSGGDSVETTGDVDNTPPLDREFSQIEEELIRLSQMFFQLDMQLDSDLSQRDKASFFLFYIALQEHREFIETFAVDDGYLFPVDEIEKIIYSHLITENFNPTDGFTDIGNAVYDSQNNTVTITAIGGAGGVMATDVVDIFREENTITIRLASYNMEKYFSENPTYEVVKYYSATFLVGDNLGDYKIIELKTQPSD